MAQIKFDLIDRFGEYPLESFDKFTLQTHLNSLAERYSQDRVKQARSYLKSIFDEVVEQEFLLKDPTPEAADSQESAAEGQAGPELGAALADPGQCRQARPPVALARYDRSTEAERVVRSALGLFR
jgi:hypothetical protein